MGTLPEYITNISEEGLVDEYTRCLYQIESLKKHKVTLTEEMLKRLKDRKHVPGFSLKVRHSNRVVQDMAKLQQLCIELGVSAAAFISCCKASFPKLEKLLERRIDKGSLNKQLLEREIIEPRTKIPYIKKDD